jgi:hypothetical protein
MKPGIIKHTIALVLRYGKLSYLPIINIMLNKKSRIKNKTHAPLLQSATTELLSIFALLSTLLSKEMAQLLVEQYAPEIICLLAEHLSGLECLDYLNLSATELLKSNCAASLLMFWVCGVLTAVIRFRYLFDSKSKFLYRLL